ncbi:MAG TPA: hypothetical protein DHV30_04350 [Balneola sp.]|nr:hypothetical protein [Balneola sp.]|tara:strand:+ start:1328 stop:1711 length:384 start_codon:yes stop_codon:yes gene_type:complete
MTWAKVLQFCLKNWKEILVVVSLLVVSFKSHMDYRALNKAYEISKEETRERIEALQAIHGEEIARREQAIDVYKKAIKDIRQDYERTQKELQEEKEKRMRDYERLFSKDKEGLANEIVDTYGFEFVE